jgi:hypothetical protein
MSSRASRSSTPGIFIFIRDKTHPKQVPKKLLRPPTFPALLKNASKLLGIPVKSLYTQDDEPVFSVQDIPPSSLVLASSLADVSEFERTEATASVTVATELGAEGERVEFEDESDISMDDLLGPEKEKSGSLAYETGIAIRPLMSLLEYLPFEWVKDPHRILGAVLPHSARFGGQVKALQQKEAVVLWNFFQGVYSLPGISVPVQQLAEELVKTATFVGSLTASVRLRHVVVGPRKSGKSTFLRVLANTAIGQLLVSGQSKSTFVVYVDFNELASVVGNPLKLYDAWIEITFKFLKAQKLTIEPLAGSLRAYFKKLVRVGNLPVLPDSFAVSDEFATAVPIVAEIASRLFDAVRRYHDLSAFLTNTVLFPRFIAQALGFTDVLFIIDHFDTADVTLIPSEPFGAGRDSVLLIEFFTFMLEHATFAVSCVNEQRCLELLSSFVNGQSAVPDGLTIVTVVDIDTDHSPRFRFQLTLDSGQKFTLTVANCGGCPGFLSLWDELVATTVRVQQEEKKDSQSPTAKELRVVLRTELLEICSVVFEGFEGKITDFKVVQTGQEV